MNPKVRSLLLGLALVGLVSPPASAFTLEQVMSAPFVSGLTAAPSGGRIAWVAEVRGVRNVWVAAPPDYRARALTRYSADDGQEIGELAWSADARTLVYTRGGAPNREGEVPNPTSDPAGAKQEVWAVSWEGGAPRRLGEGSGPAVAPRGDRVAFVKGGQIWSAPLAGPTAGPPAGMQGDKGTAAQLVHARGKADTLRWSPDGARLAFVSRREHHSFVGVYDVAGKTLRWLDPTVDQDMEPAWSPDGRALAFLRLPTVPKAIPFVPQRAGFPWSIRVADPATGRGREVFRAREGTGSVFRPLDAADQLLWSADGRLVFPWEKDGWTHLYSLTAAGGEAILLTPGDFEVENAALANSRREVLFSSNQASQAAPEDADRRHVWRVAAAGGPPVALTSGAGLEWSPVGTSDGKVVLLRGDARRPGLPAMIESGESGEGAASGASPRDLAPGLLPADFPAADLVVPKQVVFAAADGLSIHGQLFLPPDLKPGERRPAVVFFHGGSQRQMLLGWHYMKYYHHAYGFNQYLASRGFVVLSVNYRSGIGYGLSFREALNYGAGGASEFNDVLGAGLYLRGRPEVRADRIGLWGGSYGGYLTALGLARASDLFAAGVDLHGVHDWNTTIPNFARDYDPATRA
ncbi:MAG TPA: prolyl oligopeptidase family serine peptidase, partial [Thermoanaerobaculia bacterium]